MQISAQHMNGVVPHKFIGPFRFCPLADDHGLLKQHLLEEKEKRKFVQSAYNRKRRAKKKEDKAQAKVLDL